MVNLPFWLSGFAARLLTVLGRLHVEPGWHDIDFECFVQIGKKLEHVRLLNLATVAKLHFSAVNGQITCTTYLYVDQLPDD